MANEDEMSPQEEEQARINMLSAKADEARAVPEADRTSEHIQAIKDADDYFGDNKKKQMKKKSRTEKWYGGQ